VRGCFFCVKLQLLLTMSLLIVCALCVSSVSLVLPPSGALCGLIIKISLPLRPLKKNRPSAGVSAVEVDYYVIRF
jgi:hypothetical protein